MIKLMLSIIVPMYNAKDYIKKGLESIILQSDRHERYEIIIVNDGSTDISAEIVNEYVKKYPKLIRLIEQPNGGHGAACNTGIKEARGKYIKVMDADDWFNSEVLNNLVFKLSEVDADVIAMGYETYHIITKESKKEEIIVPEGNMSEVNMQYVIEKWSEVRNGFTIHGIIYKREFYCGQQIQLPEKVFYDDAYFTTMPCMNASSILLMEDILYVYRIGDVAQSVSDSSRVNRITDLDKVIKCMVIDRSKRKANEKYGNMYWHYKFISVVADFYITCLIRQTDSKTGRRQARELKKYIDKLFPGERSANIKRYYSILLMHYMRFNSKSLSQIMQSRAYLKLKRHVFTAGRKNVNN